VRRWSPPSPVSDARAALLLGLGLGCAPTADRVQPKSAAEDPVQTPAPAPGDSGPGGESGTPPDTAADTAEDTGAPAEACVPASAAELTLCADRFWAQDLDPAAQAAIDAAIAEMPAALRVTGLADSVDRARQLQWALVAAHAPAAASVAVLLPAGTYDFTGLDEPHLLVPEGDVHQRPLRPKLFVARDHLSLLPAGAEPPVLTASGPGADGVHHGRVFLLLDSAATELRVEGLVFRGDASPATFTDPAFSMHEDDAALAFRGQWGAAMVGLTGGANHATFRGCRFEQINGSGISAVGLLTVADSVFEGALPHPAEADPEDATEALFDAVLAERGASPGMDLHAGVRRSYAYGPTVIEDSVFAGLVQGVLASADGFAVHIAGSTFTDIYDHGIYVLGDAPGSRIEGNLFDGVGNGAIKFASHSAAPDPRLSTAGLRESSVRDNRFRRMRNGAMTFAGVQNEIARNEVVAYDPADDPTGWYDPFQVPGSHYPDAFLITEAGQAGWANHISRNTFDDNRTTDGPFEIFLQQRTTVEDRSISGNLVTGAGQTVYFRHLLPCASHPAPCSDHRPTIAVEDGAALVVGAPADCASCYPDDPGYLTELP